MNKDLNYYFKHAISINEFLESYYGRSDFKNKILIHENIQTLFKDIITIDFKDIVKNPELVYTGKVVLVRDANNKCIPYVTTGFELDQEYSLDDREKLIVELVSAINKFINKYSESLIILENNDNISNNLIGCTLRNISILDDNFIKINNDGGILIKNQFDIFTFKNLVSKCLENIDIYELSKQKDIISIRITNGRVYILKNGTIIELTNLIDIKNFLLKFYNPKHEELTSDLNEIELNILYDYELEYLLKKYKTERNTKMYYKVKLELNKRKNNIKKKTNIINKKNKK